MRVKLSYTVEFDDVPQIVNDKMKEIGGALEKCGMAVKPDLWEDDTLLGRLENIDRVRKQLALLDAQLEDCYSILAGYNKALAESKLPSQPETSQQDGQHD
jgi:hypothetical protein